MRKIYTLLVVLSVSVGVWSQSCTGINIGTPGATATCLDFDAAVAGSGSSAGCTGSGFGGSGTFRIVQVCTNTSAQCISFDLTGLASANGTEISLWTTCSGGAVSGYVTGSINCYSGTSNIGWSTAGLGLAANTCYYLRVWTKDPPTSTSTICANVESPTNDFCSAPQQIGVTPATYDNYCMTAGSAGDPSAAQFCAGTLENNAWFSFTTLSTCVFPCSVTLTITGISCTGGGSGFQIGYWTGACGALTNIGCTSGSGGTVTATINNLNPNQTVIVGIDGNAGAYCNFAISGTNITPLPVGLVNFAGYRDAELVNLNWQTLSETKNDHFTIYRSTDGVNWLEIGQKSGLQYSMELTSYAYIDNYRSSEDVYYRLSQTDIDGTESFLKDIVVNPVLNYNPLTVVPNPVSNGFCELRYDSRWNENVNIALYDFTGAVIYTNTYETFIGENAFDMDLSKLNKGVYLVRLQNSSESTESRIVVK